MADPKDLEGMYRRRFHGEAAERHALWKILIECVFRKYVGADDTVLDLGAGFCEFINNIKAGKRIAVDLSPHVKDSAGVGVHAIVSSSSRLKGVGDSEVDVVFSSNLLEHLERKEIVKTIREVHRVLKKGGRFLLLVPNYKYAYRDYWNFFDHVTPLDHLSVREVLELNGFSVKKVVPRFLPYTTKSRYPKSGFLVKAYLKIGLLQRILGKQMLIVAEKA